MQYKDSSVQKTPTIKQNLAWSSSDPFNNI